MSDKVIQRIDGALKHIEGIQNSVEGVSYEKFINDHLILYSVSFRLIQLGEKMIKLEQLLKGKYPELPWYQARIMRNIIVHDYENANPKIIYDTATKDIGDLKQCFLRIKDDIKHISENSLTTKRLLIRPWDDMDVEELYALASNEEIAKWCGWEPHKSINDSLFALHNFLEIKETYAICLKDSGTLVGSIGLILDSRLAKNSDECELGFWVGEQYQRNGYAFEAAKEVIRHAFEDLKMKTIWCSYFDGNEKSKGLQEKLGFKYIYTYKKCDDSNSQGERICRVNSLVRE